MFRRVERAEGRAGKKAKKRADIIGGLYMLHTHRMGAAEWLGTLSLGDHSQLEVIGGHFWSCWFRV